MSFLRSFILLPIEYVFSLCWPWFSVWRDQFMYAGHSIGSLLVWFRLLQACCPLVSNVDGFLVAARAGVFWTGGRMMDTCASV